MDRRDWIIKEHGVGPRKSESMSLARWAMGGEPIGGRPTNQDQWPTAEVATLGHLLMGGGLIAAGRLKLIG